MKPCKTCGKMRAKSAKNCPHCGALVHHSIEFILKIVIVLVALNVFATIFTRWL